MNWDAIGAIAELTGAFAVVLTLIYLAVQLRQNTISMNENRKVLLGESYQRRVQARTELSKLTAGDKELAAIYVKLEDAGYPQNVNSIEVLDPIELRRVKSLCLMQFLQIESTFYQGDLGLIDTAIHERGKAFARKMIPIWKALGIIEGETMGQFEVLAGIDTDSENA